MEKYLVDWQHAQNTPGTRFECGFCGTNTSPAYGYYSSSHRDNNKRQGFVLVCSYCNRPSFVDKEGETILFISPSAKLGKSVNGLPKDVASLYEEARLCTGAGAFTATVLVCRKILMHIAVEKGAKPNQGFIDYIKYLAEKNYIPPDGRIWVDYIRTKSNEANHEINLMNPKDAEDLITFVEMLLRLVYEFPSRLPQIAPP